MRRCSGAVHERVCRRAGFRQIVVAVKTPTLAEKLGHEPHESPLLRKAAALGLGPAELQSLAVQRGCIHYSSGDDSPIPLVSEDQLTNEELAISLLCVALPYEPHSIRCGAAMLGAEGNSPESLARLAVEESSVVPVRHVAEAGRKFEPENRFWRQLLDALPASAPPVSGVLPHPTRFVSMTGFTRKGPGLVVEWLHPQHRLVATT